MKIVKFIAAGRLVHARILAEDSDPRALLWLVDMQDPDQEFWRLPQDCTPVDGADTAQQ